MVRQDEAFCSVGRQSDLAGLLRRTRLIVWDEAPMLHRRDLECVERSLRDLRMSEAPFGGICMLLAGDFRQLLAVVRGGTAANTIDACLCQSSLWPMFRQHRLTRNLRLGEGDEAYARFLLQVSS